MANFDESKHPRSHGQFASSPGAQGGDLHERATASLQDHAFVTQHGDRLSRAGDEVRAQHPGREATDEVHNQAQTAIHAEAMRIHAEQDAIGGNAHLQQSADSARANARQWQRADAAGQHDSAMRAVAREADAQSRGFASHEAEHEHIETERAKTERAAEDKAIAAGHVSSEVRDVVDRHIASEEARRATAEQHAETLDRAHGAAADALAALHAYGSEEHEHLDTSGIVNGEHFHDTQNALHEAIGLDEHGGYERESDHYETPQHPDDASLMEGERYQPHENAADNAPFARHTGLEYVPHPDNSEHGLTDEQHAHQLAAHEAWQQRAEAVHGEAMAAHEAEFKRRAEAAQTALEQLHEHQLAAHDALKASDKDSAGARRAAEKQLYALSENDGEDLVNHAAFAHHERDYGTADGKPEHPDDVRDPQYLVDDRAREDYGNAHTAAQTMVERSASRLDEHSSFHAHDVFEPLKDSMRATRDSIKALAKITGRAARLPERPGRAKKAVARYCKECGRQLAAG